MTLGLVRARVRVDIRCNISLVNLLLRGAAREGRRRSRVRVMVMVMVKVKVRFRVQKYLVFDPCCTQSRLYGRHTDFMTRYVLIF